MVEINIEELTKKFPGMGDELAVDNVSASIGDGEFFSLLGPSGCGKTTTLRMIAGLEQPTSGEIYFGDERMTDASPQERNVAMVFQDVALCPHMTIYDNMGYALKVRGETDNYDEKIREAAEVLQISDQLDKKPAQLSGGQQQRVSLGRAIVRDPNAILLDEPLSDLDAKLKAELRVELQRIHKEFDMTMVYVTHDQEEAMTMSDRIALMNGGKMAQVDPPESLFHSPNNTFVAGFIGQPRMNTLDAVLQPSGELLYGGDLIATISTTNETLDGMIADQSEVLLGFRPRHTRISEDANTSIISAEIVLSEPIGVDYVIYLVTESGDDIQVVSSEVPTVKEGDQVGIQEISQCYIFDKASGDVVAELDSNDIKYHKREQISS
jgi:multiple sugar transport system ATP-binding protein